MAIDNLTTLLVAPPGRFRESLRVLLSAAGWILEAGVADNVDAGIEMIASKSPDLVLLDAGLPDGGAWAILDYVKKNIPRVRCLVLTHTKQEFNIAQNLGVDDILPDGFSSEFLFGTFQHLASEEIC